MGEEWYPLSLDARAIGLGLTNPPSQNVTPSYKAPEIVLGSAKYTYPADVWSVGCIFAEMVINRPLFDGPTEFHERISIFRLMGTPSEETWPGVNSLFGFLHYFSKSEPKDLTVVFPFLEPAGIDLLQKMLCVNPRGRITVDDAQPLLLQGCDENMKLTSIQFVNGYYFLL